MTTLKRIRSAVARQIVLAIIDVRDSDALGTLAAVLEAHNDQTPEVEGFTVQTSHGTERYVFEG